MSYDVNVIARPVVDEEYTVQLLQCLIKPVASLEGGGRIAPGDTLQGGDTRPKIIFLWLNLERTLDKRRQKMTGEETTG